MKYLFFDIDGTLVSHEKGLIPSAKEAIEACQAKGYRCFLATGRHLASLSHVKELHMDGIIYCNGGGIKIGDEIVATYPIPHDICSKTVFQAEHRYGAYSLMSSYQTIKNDAEIERLKKFIDYDHRYATIEEKLQAFGAKPWTEYRNQEILKIDIGFEKEEMMDDFLKEMDASLKLASTAGYHVEEGRKSGEITRIDVNKGEAIFKLVKMLGGRMEDTYGFGDSSNDLEMLEMCHTGIAMGNAFDEVKQKANFVTKHVNEDGIAYAMHTLGIL